MSTRAFRRRKKLHDLLFEMEENVRDNRRYALLILKLATCDESIDQEILSVIGDRMRHGASEIQRDWERALKLSRIKRKVPTCA